MSLKDLFLIFSKNDYEKELKKKITSLETSILELKKTLTIIQNAEKEKPLIVEKEPPIIIEKINIEKIVLDKYELNNNFGQLGIKELKGKLNIGATYGSEFIPQPSEAQKKEQIRQKKTPPPEKGPKVNILTKNEN